MELMEPAGKLKILIAEDDKFMQSLYKRGVSEDKYDIRYVTNGQDVLNNCESWSPDVIVLDIVMPVMSGFEALKKIKEKEKIDKLRAEENEKKSPVIIMATAMGSRNDIMDCLKLGINGYIVKPINWETIESQIIGYYEKAIAKKSSSKP